MQDFLYPRLALNSPWSWGRPWSSCLRLQSVGITNMCHHARVSLSIKDYIPLFKLFAYLFCVCMWLWCVCSGACNKWKHKSRRRALCALYSLLSYCLETWSLTKCGVHFFFFYPTTLTTNTPQQSSCLWPTRASVTGICQTTMASLFCGCWIWTQVLTIAQKAHNQWAASPTLKIPYCSPSSKGK